MISRRKFARTLAQAAIGVPLLIRSAQGIGFSYNFHNAPAAAVARGYNRLVFCDDFNASTTVDFADSGAEGFNWYRRLLWPNSINTGWHTSPTTSADALAVQDSVLTVLTNTIPGTLTIMSAAHADNEQGYVGKMFDPTQGYYLEFRARFDPSLADPEASPMGWPAIYASGKNFFIGGNDHYIEPDFFEAYVTGVGTIQPLMGIHDWVINVSNLEFNPSLSSLGSPDYRQWHTFGTRLIPTAANSGTGLFERFFDNSQVSAADLSYTLTTGSTPPSSGGNPNGVFSLVEQQHFPILIGTQPGMPLYIDWIAIWAP